MIILIKEKSLIARIAALFLHEKSIAVVTGKTIHLWNTSKEDFINNKKWLQHELMHVQQFKKYGFIRFLFLYTWESLKKGYHKNRFEVEARGAENNNILSYHVH